MIYKIESSVYIKSVQMNSLTRGVQQVGLREKRALSFLTLRTWSGSYQRGEVSVYYSSVNLSLL